MKFALLLLCLCACDPPERGPMFRAATDSQTPRDGGTMRFSLILPIPTLDPSVANDEASGYVLHTMFDTLLDYAPSSLELIPRLADHYTVTPDGLVYTFTLRDGLVYADGTPLVAADFKSSFERAMTAPESPFGAYLGDLAGAQEVLDGKTRDCTGIVVVSPTVLELHLAHPYPALVFVLTMPFTTPQPAAHIKAAGEQLRRQPLASGPFELASWDEGQRLVLRRNPRYYDAHRAHLDGIVLVENTPRDTQFLMFERGELDAAERLAAPDFLFVTTQPAWKPYIHQVAVMNAYGSRMNVTVKPFSDVRVRRALNYAVDKAHIARLLNNTIVPSHGLLAPGMAGRDASIQPYPHDPARARQLLAEAGYPNGFDTEYVINSDEEAEKLAAAMQSDLADVGVRMHIAVMSWSTYLTAIASRAHNAPFSLGTWIGDFPDASNFLDARFHSRMISDENSNNDSFYKNPELDAILDRARGEVNPDARAALYRQAEKILYDDCPWVWGYHRLMTEVVQPYVKGYSPHPIWLRDYTSAWLDLGPDGKPVRAR